MEAAPSDYKCEYVCEIRYLAMNYWGERFFFHINQKNIIYNRTQIIDYMSAVKEGIDWYLKYDLKF